MTKRCFIYEHCKQRVPSLLWQASLLLTPLVPRIENKGHYAINKLWTLSSVTLTSARAGFWALLLKTKSGKPEDRLISGRFRCSSQNPKPVGLYPIFDFEVNRTALSNVYSAYSPYVWRLRNVLNIIAFTYF